MQFSPTQIKSKLHHNKAQKEFFVKILPDASIDKIKKHT